MNIVAVYSSLYSNPSVNTLNKYQHIALFIKKIPFQWPHSVWKWLLFELDKWCTKISNPFSSGFINHTNITRCFSCNRINRLRTKDIKIRIENANTLIDTKINYNTKSNNIRQVLSLRSNLLVRHSSPTYWK